MLFRILATPRTTNMTIEKQAYEDVSHEKWLFFIAMSCVRGGGYYLTIILDTALILHVMT